jgi:hypothetical protein
MRLAKLLSRLNAQADDQRGRPQHITLPQGLGIDLKVCDTLTYLQLHRSAAPGPSDKEFQIVIANWPYTPPNYQPVRLASGGRHYLTTTWPTPIKLL